MTQKPESQERPRQTKLTGTSIRLIVALSGSFACLADLAVILPRLNWLASSSSPTDKRHRAGVSPGQDQNDSRRTLRTLRGRFLPLESPAPANALRVCMTLSGSQAASE